MGNRKGRHAAGRCQSCSTGQDTFLHVNGSSARDCYISKVFFAGGVDSRPREFRRMRICRCQLSWYTTATRTDPHAPTRPWTPLDSVHSVDSAPRATGEAGRARRACSGRIDHTWLVRKCALPNKKGKEGGWQGSPGGSTRAPNYLCNYHRHIGSRMRHTS